MKIKVRAIKLGYMHHIRQKEGSVFEIDEKLFSKQWMEKVGKDEPTGKAAKMKKDESRKPMALSQVDAADVALPEDLSEQSVI